MHIYIAVDLKLNFKVAFFSVLFYLGQEQILTKQIFSTIFGLMLMNL